MSIITHDKNGVPTMIAGTPDIAHYDASKNNNVPGIVTLYDTDTVSAKAAGAALHASEKNPAVAGSLAEQIENVDDKVGDPSAASAVAGADAFSKINALNTSLESFPIVNNYVVVSQSAVTAGTDKLVSHFVLQKGKYLFSWGGEIITPNNTTTPILCGISLSTPAEAFHNARDRYVSGYGLGGNSLAMSIQGCKVWDIADTTHFYMYLRSNGAATVYPFYQITQIK